MKYGIQFKPRAAKDIEALPSRIRKSVLARIEAMSDNLKGDIKRLAMLTPEYRLRIGDYRALFTGFGIGAKHIAEGRYLTWQLGMSR